MAINTQATSAASLRARGVDWAVLRTTLTGNSGWVDISGTLPIWTLFLKGLETGSTVKVEAANGAAAPTNGTVLAAALAPDTNGTAVYICTAPFHWVRITKTQGATPTATVANLHALFA